VGAHINIATPPIWKFGTDDQKERYLRPAIAGEKIGALAITERGTGSRGAAPARGPGAGCPVPGGPPGGQPVGGGWVVNGEKTYITNGVRADFMVTAVRTAPEGGHPGIWFLIAARTPGGPR